MTVVIELLLRREAEQEYMRVRLGQLREILGMLRAGPLEYDAERPNGRPAALRVRTNNYRQTTRE